MTNTTFTATIQSSDSGGAYVEIPFNVETLFGSKRPKIKALFDDKITYRGTLVRMKTIHHILIVKKDIRQALGKNPGDLIQVSIEKDNETRIVVVPQSLQGVLNQNEEIASFFHSLSYTCQKEYTQYLEEAKRLSTKERRLKKVIERLEKKEKYVR